MTMLIVWLKKTYCQPEQSNSLTERRKAILQHTIQLLFQTSLHTLNVREPV